MKPLHVLFIDVHITSKWCPDSKLGFYSLARVLLVYTSQQAICPLKKYDCNGEDQMYSLDGNSRASVKYRRQSGG